MLKKTFLLLISVTFAASYFGLGCKGGGSGDSGPLESGDCVGGGWCGEQEINVTANIAGAEAMFIASSNSSVVGDISAEKAITVSSESPLFSVTTSGVTSVLAAAYSDATDALSGLPRLSFVAVSPIGHVILVFEHPFIYTDTAADGTGINNYSDPWAESSPFTCQIFVVNKKINDPTLNSSDPPRLTCLTTQLILNTWDFRAAMIQFDGDGGVYFTAHVPQNWKNVLLKWTPDADGSVNGDLSEVINANICFREFLVTNEGGVLYTGITSTTGDCNGTSFLRYRTPAGALQEVTSGWWEYVFKPIESTDFVSANIADPNITSANTGQILFYGPDPELATSPEWNDACLFKFNPSASGDARSIKIADCNIDIWQYLNDASTLASEKTRCTETKSMLGGGNIPEKILLADLNGDAANYEIYVVGNIYEKKDGDWLYDMCVNEAHCVNSSSVPTYTYADNQGGCEGVTGNTWKTYGDCYNQFTDSTLYTAINTGGAAANDTNWQLNGQWCQQPGSDWRDTYSAFAWVIWNGDNGTPADDTDDTKQIIRFSDNNEIVRNGWIIANTPVYSSFVTSGADAGTYKLRKIVWTDADADSAVDTTDGADSDTVPDEITKTDLLSGIEVYELFADPRSNHAGEWFFNGLRFSDNQYITGTFNPSAASPSSTLVTEAGITGQIETLVIVPNF